MHSMNIWWTFWFLSKFKKKEEYRDHVTFTGKPSKSVKKIIMRAIGIFVLPSKRFRDYSWLSDQVRNEFMWRVPVNTPRDAYALRLIQLLASCVESELTEITSRRVYVRCLLLAIYDKQYSLTGQRILIYRSESRKFTRLPICVPKRVPLL